MVIRYGSLAHILSILFAIALCAALFFLLRGKSRKTQRTVILAIMALNVFQHLFKSVVYPQYAGLGFTSLNTAYNMCATLILLSPIAMLVDLKPLRDFVFYIGSVAGLAVLFVPYWSIGKTLFDPEFLRSFICHAMLFISSILPLLLGHHKPSYKCAFMLGADFLAVILIIILNDAACVLLGIYPGVEGLSLADALYKISPVWSFGPPEEFSWVVRIVDVLSPDAFVGNGGATPIVPLLWYAIPLYLGITLIALPICIAADLGRFKEDAGKIFTKK